MRTVCALVMFAASLPGPGSGRAGARDPVTEDEQALQAAKVKTDGTGLLEFFRQRTLSADERAKVEELIVQLGAKAFKVREKASAALVARGPVVLPMLRRAMKNPDLEVARRAERCAERITEKDYPAHVPAAAARLLRQRKPAEAVGVLLAYLPFADNEAVADEVTATLGALAIRDGRPEKALVAALADKSPVLRAAAAEALAQHDKSAVRKLLTDPDATVRARVAAALLLAGERDAAVVLINALPELTSYSWRAEDLLYRLAEGKTAPAVSLGGDEAARRKCRDAWLAWWKANGPAVNLAKLHERPALLGNTLIVMLDAGRVLEVGPDNRVHWDITNLLFPLDAQYLAGDRVLVAEYHASRVTERTIRGDIVWQYRVFGPLAAQRLVNGHTFILSDNQEVSLLTEVDKAGSVVFRHSLPGRERIMKATKLPNGEIVCLTSGPRVVRLDAHGKEVRSFPVTIGMRLFGGRIDVQPTGRVLVPHHAENKVIEYDAQGKVVWEVAVEQPIAAVRLPNGHTLVTSMSQNRAIELDRSGREVWQYRSGTRVTRAYRR